MNDDVGIDKRMSIMIMFGIVVVNRNNDCDIMIVMDWYCEKECVCCVDCCV